MIAANIDNDLNLTFPEFRHSLYKAIIGEIPRNEFPESLDFEIALALFLLRGSPDLNRGFYSVDLKYVTDEYANDFEKILLSSNELYGRLNLNFRELQPQFVAGTHLRNTQVRVNLKWFYDNVLKQSRQLNPYKVEAVENKISEIGETRTYPSFVERIAFYRARVLGRELNPSELESLRLELDFSSLSIEEEQAEPFVVRNMKITAYAREILEDKCVGCSDLFPIESRSFKMPRNDRYYLEINHVVAFSSANTVTDVFDNLVKLCPTCHRALTPRRAHENLQRSIIQKMIDSRPEVKSFVESMNPNSDQSGSDFVLRSLR